MSDTLVQMTDGTETTDPANRIRLIIDTEEELRRAVRLRAAKEGVSPSDVVNGLIRAHLAFEVQEAHDYMSAAKKRRKS